MAGVRPRDVRAPSSPRAGWRNRRPCGRGYRRRPAVRRAVTGSLRRMSDWNFARVWDSIAAEAPERVAVVCGSDTRTYGELPDTAHRAARLAGPFAARDVGPGAKVAIDLLNRPEYLETFYAALLLGAVPVNVNYRYGVEETRYLLEDADAAVVVTEDRFAAVVADAVAAMADAPLVITLGAGYDA